MPVTGGPWFRCAARALGRSHVSADGGWWISVTVLAVLPLTVGDSAIAQQELAGRPVLEHVLTALREAASVDEAVVVPVTDSVIWSELADVLSRHDALDIVVVHDPLRPLAPPDLIDEVVAAVTGSTAAAAVPVLPVTDTLKAVDGDGHVTSTLDRARFQVVSTPIAVDATALHAALDAAGMPPNESSGEPAVQVDRAARLVGLLTGQGLDIVTVPGRIEAMRVPDAAHLAAAAAVLASREVGSR
jgi:2-C-methyl-D-erythritol 4-phosphate cytidylyltransferase